MVRSPIHPTLREAPFSCRARYKFHVGDSRKRPLFPLYWGGFKPELSNYLIV